MNTTTRSWLIGAGIGAGVMFLLDPTGGGRRRALLRDKTLHAGRVTKNAVTGTACDLTNRVTGLVARVRSWAGEEHADDRTVIERVRAALGRVAAQPRAIHVESRSGWIILTGKAAADEIPSITSAVEAVRGVSRIDNQLSPA